MALLNQVRLFLIQHKRCSFNLLLIGCSKVILNLTTAENKFIRGDVKDTDIVVHISVKTYF